MVRDAVSKCNVENYKTPGIKFQPLHVHTPVKMYLHTLNMVRHTHTHTYTLNMLRCTHTHTHTLNMLRLENIQAVAMTANFTVCAKSDQLTLFLPSSQAFRFQGFFTDTLLQLTRQHQSMATGCMSPPPRALAGALLLRTHLRVLTSVLCVHSSVSWRCNWSRNMKRNRWLSTRSMTWKA